MIHETISFANKFGLNPGGKDKSLSIMYWTSKMHKEVIGASYIAASKKAIQISKAASNAFRLIFHQIQSFYGKSCFYFSFKQFWATENSKRILEKIEKINYTANAIKLFRDLTFPQFILNYLILI